MPSGLTAAEWKALELAVRDGANPTCPACGTRSLERVLSVVVPALHCRTCDAVIPATVRTGSSGVWRRDG